MKGFDFLFGLLALAIRTITRIPAYTKVLGLVVVFLLIYYFTK
jgi:hypothetical protein